MADIRSWINNEYLNKIDWKCNVTSNCHNIFSIHEKKCRGNANMKHPYWCSTLCFAAVALSMSFVFKASVTSLQSLKRKNFICYTVFIVRCIWLCFNIDITHLRDSNSPCLSRGATRFFITGIVFVSMNTFGVYNKMASNMLQTEFLYTLYRQYSNHSLLKRRLSLFF